MSELKACPFCGFTIVIGVFITPYRFRCMCSKCGSIITKDTKENAIEAWNTRTYPPEVLELVRVCKNFRESYCDSLNLAARRNIDEALKPFEREEGE